MSYFFVHSKLCFLIVLYDERKFGQMPPFRFVAVEHPAARMAATTTTQKFPEQRISVN